MADLNSIGGIHYEMMRRCYNEKSVAYKDYGAKGIKVCEEWHNREVFKKWARDNGYVKGLRLERINSKGDYEPNNCKFGTKHINRNIGRKIKENAKINKQKKIDAGILGSIQDEPLYKTYISMHSRCERSSHLNYKNYGGRGINVCIEWSGKNGFFNFNKWAINNGWKKGLTIDRIDNNKGYYPDNCRWVTGLQQNYNKRNNITYEYCGVLMPLGMIAKLENIKYGMLYLRVRQKGMSVNEAIADIKQIKQ